MSICRCTIAAALLALAIIGPVRANEVATGWSESGAQVYDGIRGNQGLRTDPTTVQSVGFVHPVQIDIGPSGGDFVAVGTANGAGVSGTLCADDYDPMWSIYVDWIIGGVYACRDISLDAYGAGTSPSFVIRWGYCEAFDANRWVFYFGGTERFCVNSTAHAGVGLGAGIEATNTTVDRNIDAKYTNMQVNYAGSGTWTNLGDSSEGWVDPNYTYQFVSNTSFNVYLAPLD